MDSHLESHLESVFAGVGPALASVGMSDVANELFQRVGSLNGTMAIERAAIILDGIGPELVQAYMRAGAFLKNAPPSLRPDAVKYQADLFTARCHVAAARETARRALKGDFALN